jgi:predicted naringenin-chalcone synthase
VVARLSPPCQAQPGHEITLGQVTERHAQLHSRLARPAKDLRRSARLIEASGVERRRWVRPLDRVLGERDLDAAFRETYEALRVLAVQAAAQALDQQGLRPHDIAGVVVSSTTGWHMPSLEVHVMNALGLPQTIRRVIGTTLGCAGAPWAGARAWEQLAVFPDDKILVLSAEAFSLTQHEDDDTTPSFVYRGIAGDGVFACIAAANVTGLSLRVHGPAFETTLYGSANAYEMNTGARGLVFESERTALQWLPKAMPAMREWLRADYRDAWPLDFVISHTGGVKIMDTVEEELCLAPHALRHARASFRERGNMASASVWDVARRTLADPPPPGTRGVMLAPGPGFSLVALKVSIGG